MSEPHVVQAYRTLSRFFLYQLDFLTKIPVIYEFIQVDYRLLLVCCLIFINTITYNAGILCATNMVFMICYIGIKYWVKGYLESFV